MTKFKTAALAGALTGGFRYVGVCTRRGDRRHRRQRRGRRNLGVIAGDRRHVRRLVNHWRRRQRSWWRSSKCQQQRVERRQQRQSQCPRQRPGHGPRHVLQIDDAHQGAQRRRVIAHQIHGARAGGPAGQVDDRDKYQAIAGAEHRFRRRGLHFPVLKTGAQAAFFMTICRDLAPICSADGEERVRRAAHNP